MRVLVTGGSGFVGQALVCALVEQGKFMVRTTLRDVRRSRVKTDVDVVMATLSPENNWREALADVDVVVHTAARVHGKKEQSTDALSEFRVLNLEGTLNLAKQSAHSGVRRFIFISTIKVNGECTQPRTSFTADDPRVPEDDYGVSKAEAEIALTQLAQETNMEVVIIRPPLVYGPGVKGNFKSLIDLVARGFPLPLGCATENRRSLVALDNLVDLILVCITHPAAANQTFLVGDGEDLSTAELLCRIGQALKRPARLLNVPASCLAFVARLLRKKAVMQRLFGNLQVDITHTCKTLGWKPPISVNEGLRRAVQGLSE